jgi:hypothetical protein
MPNHDGLFDAVIYVAEVTNKRNEDVEYPPGKVEGSISGADMLFAVDVQYSINGRNQYLKNVKPANPNIKQIPIVGESVLVFQTINHESNFDETFPQWYYMFPIGVSSNINTNIVPTVDPNIEFDLDYPYDTKTSYLQPYKGDILLEGRFGNSIRFSSTIDFKDTYTQPGNWSGINNGDPILILSNGREYKENKQFVTENINTDKSSLYLTSTQKIPLTLGSENQPNSLTGALTPLGTETNYIGSQLLGVSDRVILKARTDLAVIDSPLGIVLNSTGDIKLGAEDAAVSMVHGDILLSVLQNIINQLNTIIQCGSASGTFINLQYAEKAQTQLQELLSSKYFMDFKPYKTEV